MAVVWIVPLAFAIAIVSPLVAERFNSDIRLTNSQVALALFGDVVGEDTPRRKRQQRRLRAAHAKTTHRVYASRTLLYSMLFGVAGSIAGVYATAVLLWSLQITGEAIRETLPPALSVIASLTRVRGISVEELFVLMLLSSATFGAVLAYGTYELRWHLLDQRARARATEIEATLPRTIAFVYALSRSGMAFPAVLTTLTKHRRVYGEAAIEVGVAVRDMNTFGTDILTALDRMAARTPSEGMRELGENLSAVLGSGQSLSEFLHEQYERYQEEAASQQTQYLELLSTFAEAYVTLFVAGPLFLITILAVIGLVLEDTLRVLRLIVYVAVPLSTVVFMVYIDSVTRTLTDAISDTEVADQPEVPIRGKTSPVRAVTGQMHPDGGVETGLDRWVVSRERLDAYESFERAIAWLRQPGTTIRQNPWTTFLLTVPLGLVWMALRIDELPSGVFAILEMVDSPVTEALLFALAVYAGVHEYEKRRIRAIERVVPDFLDRLASVNDAGASVVKSLERLSKAEMGGLTPELRRTWRDVKWGANVQTAFRRMDRRIKSPMVTRATTLAANAMSVSGDIGPVLEIAADEARQTRQLRKERNQEMVTYLLVIYISYFVFIAIIVSLTVSFIPAIEAANLGGSGNGVPEGFSTGMFTRFESVDTNAYSVLFFHTAVIQSVFSGLVAGQLGEGRIADGTKHAVVLIAFTLLTFTLI